MAHYVHIMHLCSPTRHLHMADAFFVPLMQGGVSVEELLQDSVRTQFIYSAKCPSCATDSNSCTEPVVKCWHDATSLKDTGGVKCHQVISPSNRPQDITDITFVRCQQVSTGTAQLGLTNNENEATEVTLNGNINIAASENCDIVRPTADREVSVKISYQNASGDGKHLDSTETMLHHDVSKATPNQDAMGTIPNHGSLTHEDIIRSNPSQDIDHGHGSLTHEDIIRSNPSQDIAGVMPRRYIKESSSKHNVAFTSCQQPNRNRTAHRDVSSTPLRQYTARSPFLVGLSHTLSIARVSHVSFFYCCCCCQDFTLMCIVLFLLVVSVHQASISQCFYFTIIF